MPVNRSRVSIVVLNWNGWRDTIECLESLCRLDYSDYGIVVVDNGSTDGSIEHICAWVSGTEPLKVEVPESLRRLVQPPVAKPLTWRVLDAATEGMFAARADRGGLTESALTIIRAEANLGYAGGNNVGIRYALAQGAQYVWILNNDTVVDCRALGYLVERMSLDQTIGLCGCTLLEYLDPHLVQAASGAHYDYRTARQKNCGRGLAANARLDTCKVEQLITYVAGASVMATRVYLQDVGLMNECYFLYFEELDWAIRGKRRGFHLGYANDALVYHKQGASTGSSEKNLVPTPFAQYFATRNLLLMTSLFYRPWFPVIWLKTIGTALKYFLKGHLALARAVGLAMLNPNLATDPDRVRKWLSKVDLGARRHQISRRG